MSKSLGRRGGGSGKSSGSAQAKKKGGRTKAPGSRGVANRSPEEAQGEIVPPPGGVGNPISQGEVHHFEMEVEVFSGPLPPPAVLEQYGAMQPDAPDRIITMAENQQKHSHEMERMVFSAGIAGKKRAMWMGFVFSVLLISFSLIAGLAGVTQLTWGFGALGVLGFAAGTLIDLFRRSPFASGRRESARNEDE